MSDSENFETRFSALLRRYAAEGATLSSTTLAAAVDAGIDQRRRTAPLPWRRYAPALAATAVFVLAAVLALTVWMAGGLFGPGATHSPHPILSLAPTARPSATPSTAPSPLLSPTPFPTWGPDAGLGGWPLPIRIETARGSLDVEMHATSDENVEISDPIGDVGAGAQGVDITTLTVQHRGYLHYDAGAGVRFTLADLPADVPDPARQWIAYGVVVDTDGDGVGDFQVGMDNEQSFQSRELGLQDSHRVWVTDLRTGATEVIPWIGNFFSVPHMFIYGSYRGSPDPTLGFHGSQVIFGEGFRFYGWASVIGEGGPMTDFAPDEGWVGFTPPDAP